MKISKKAQYGLRAMVYLAKAKKTCSLRKISSAEKIPFDFLEKIMSQLEKAGLVKSKKGTGGGYFLARKSNKISAGQIVSLLEGTKPVNCSCCQRARRCMTKSVWRKVELSLHKALNINLSELI